MKWENFAVQKKKEVSGRVRKKGEAPDGTNLQGRKKRGAQRRRPARKRKRKCLRGQNREEGKDRYSAMLTREKIKERCPSGPTSEEVKGRRHLSHKME